MNETLKEIAKQAQVEHCISHVRLQEFAELIIQECCKVAHHNHFVNRLILADIMNKHFEIKE